MLIKLSLAVVGALTVLPPNVCASENAMSRCVDVSAPKIAIIARNHKCIELTSTQCQSLHGVYGLNGEAPADPPCCDYRAVLTQLANHDVGVVSLIGGDKARTPVHAPPELLALINDVATTKINHDGIGH